MNHTWIRNLFVPPLQGPFVHNNPKQGAETTSKKKKKKLIA